MYLSAIISIYLKAGLKLKSFAVWNNSLCTTCQYQVECFTLLSSFCTKGAQICNLYESKFFHLASRARRYAPWDCGLNMHSKICVIFNRKIRTSKDFALWSCTLSLKSVLCFGLASHSLPMVNLLGLDRRQALLWKLTTFQICIDLNADIWTLTNYYINFDLVSETHRLLSKYGFIFVISARSNDLMTSNTWISKLCTCRQSQKHTSCSNYLAL